MSDDLTLLPLGPFAIEGAPTSIDARCGRLRFQPKNGQIVCCARGACIDGRARLEIVGRASLRWSSEGPMQHDPAPSGIVERLADVRLGEVVACAALDDVRGGVRGEACGIRRLAREAKRREDEWLLEGCALFPLDLREGELVPSARIDASLLVEAGVEAGEGPSLWDEARARVVLRFGEEVGRAIDEAMHALRTHHARALHLKTLK